MKTIMERLLIYTGCCILFLGNDSEIKSVYLMLLILITNELFLIIDTKVSDIMIILLFIAACFLFPETIYFLPLFFYQVLYRGTFFLTLLFLIPLLTMQELNAKKIACILFLTVLAGYMGERLRKEETLEQLVIRLQDTAKENEMLLKEKNRELKLNQDNEIHMAMLKERNRIAREIHDNVGHLLSRSILLTGAMLAVNTQDNLKESLTGLKETLTTAMNQIRSSVHDLHDDSIDLKGAVTQMVKEFTFCKAVLDYDMENDCSREVKNCFLTVIKEALNNVIKHSNAECVNIVVREHPGIYQLEIRDNGTKEVKQQTIKESDGLGLSGMKERVEALSGQILVDSEHGFRIFISIPKGGAV